MAHFIQAIIGRNKQLQQFALRWKNVALITLPQDISIIPWSIELRNEINNNLKSYANSITSSFEFASPFLFEILKSESSNGQIGYIETNYFGGNGVQSAILFMNRETIGPYKTESFQKNEKNAINKVLEILGVDNQNFQDEFAALGLMDIRSNESIIKKYGS